ncbi:FtsX-like permease family protein [Nocardioides acrostichi]|uniref:ABC3 transporter permease C-terminal domain-containing protein n=1 Tax=Nocardioides acrostichi TaxID=2784339 RepID=A0A930V202_9ACTN|nr:FtsX-like permease family protein [Nocardioides acrostichi]MBF4162421.1 hypothetical protein [Nocardioides acrostichi]
MDDARSLAWLARRFVQRGAGAWLSLLLAVGMAVIVLVGLGSASAIQAIGRQHQRSTDLSAVLVPDGGSAESIGLRMIDPAALTQRRWNGRTIDREFFAAGDDASADEVAIPGVPRVPQAGDFYASPDLVRLVERDPVVAALFGAEHLVGTIDDVGLRQPHELRAVIGVSARRGLLVPVEGFGGDSGQAGPASEPAEAVASQRVLDLSVAGYVVVLVWLPLGFFLVVVSRLASARRRQRVAALRLIGVDARRVWALQFLEASAVCIPAGIVAAGLYTWTTSWATRLPGTDVGFFASDVQLSFATRLVICLGLIGTTCGCVAADARERRPARRAATADASISRTGVGALVLGLLLLALPSLTDLRNGLTPLALWGGLVAAAAGLAVAGPQLVTRVLGRRLGSAGPTQLVGRRLASDRVALTLRLAGVMSVIIVLLIGSVAFTALLDGGTAQAWEARARAQQQVPIVATDLSGALTLSRVRSVPALDKAIEVRSVTTGSVPLGVVFATCDELAGLVGAASPGNCESDPGPRWLGRLPTQARLRSLGSTIDIAGAGRVRLPGRVGIAWIEGLPRQLRGALVLPPSRAPSTPQGDGATFLTLSPASSARVTLATFSSLEPTIQFDLGALDRHNPDTQQYPTQVEWLRLAAALSLLIGLLAMLVVAMADAQERGPRVRVLRVLGASRRQLFAVHLWAVWAPATLAGFMAIATGWLVVLAMHHIDDRAGVSGSLYGALAAAVVLSTLGVALWSWPTVLRSTERAGAVDS